MPLEILWEEDGVVRRFHGTVTTGDILNSLDLVHLDMRFSTLKFSINDFLDVTSVDVSKADLAKTALRTIADSQVNSSVLVAIVATQPEIKALADFYSSPTHLPYRSRTFDTVVQARHWIATQ